MSGSLVKYEPEQVKRRFAWWTGILKSRSGIETRQAYLQAPRESFELIVAADLERSRRDLRLALFTDPVSTWSLPLRDEAVAAQNTITATSVTIDATFADWVTVGQAVYVEGPDHTQGYQTTINGLAGPTNARVLTLLAGPTGGPYPKDITFVMPVSSVYLDDGQTVERAAAEGSTAAAQLDIGTADWRLTARAAAFGATFGTGAVLTAYDGYTILDRRPNVADKFAESIDAGLRRFDYGGSVAQEWHRTYPDINRSHRFEPIATDGDLTRQYWKLFGQTLLGRQVAFLLPTWQPDLDLFSQPAGTSQLRVYKTPGVAGWFSKGHVRFQLLKSTGAVEYAKGSSFVDNGDGTETITLTGVVGAGTVTRVSYIELCRLGEDELALTATPDGPVVDLRAVVVQR